MKKLMIVAAVAMAAVCAKATQINWSATGLDATDGNIVFTFFSADPSGSCPITTVDAAIAWVQTANNEALLGALASGNMGMIDSGAFGAGPTTVTPNIANGTTVSAFAIIVDSDFMTWMGEETFDGPYAVSKYSVVGEKDFYVGNGGVTQPFTFAASDQQDWQSVPEPTSGLLLLLGVAGLALRRRRA